MTAAEFLARAHAVTDAATEGPWGQVPGRNRQVFGPVVMLVDADGASYEDRGHIAMSGPEDAAFIAASRTMLPTAVAAIEAVLAIHFSEKRWQPDREAEFSYSDEEQVRDEWPDSEPTYFEVCAECKVIEEGPCDGECTSELGYRESLWPCPTVRAVTAALDGLS